MSGVWKLNSQHLLQLKRKQHNSNDFDVDTFYKPLLGTKSFVTMAGDDQLLIPEVETDNQSFSFRYFRGEREENNHPPMFLWKSDDKCVSTQLGTITGKPHGSWNYRNDLLETKFHFS